MALKQQKPRTPSKRNVVTFTSDRQSEYIEPSKTLVKGKARKSGRNHLGRITVNHRGGGAKRKYRQVDFKRKKWNVPGKVKGFVYDPYRNADLAYISYEDGSFALIVATSKMEVGDVIVTGEKVEPSEGNRMYLKEIPVGSVINNIEMRPGSGAKVVRSAGASAILMAKDSGRVAVKLPSGEMRYFLENCMATMGSVGNEGFRNQRKGSAGDNRRRGRRPTVRGAAMNACDHPHGGGEGKAPVGQKGPKTATGRYALGPKTSRRSKRGESHLLIRRRNKRKRR